MALPIICKTVEYTDQSDNSSCSVHVLNGRLIADWLVENMNPDMILYRMLVDGSVMP